MEKRQYGMDDKLIIKSDRKNMDKVFAFVIGWILVVPAWILSFGVSGRTYVEIPFFTLLLGIPALFEWVGVHRVLVMEKKGCTVCFYRYRKFYTWEELAIKRWEKYSHTAMFLADPSDNNYNEGVFFSKHPVKKSKRRTPMNYIEMKRPLTCFCVNFYPKGITEGHGDYQSRRAAGTASKAPKRWPEKYPVDKEVFVNYMKLWEVDIEGLSMDTENIRYV